MKIGSCEQGVTERDIWMEQKGSQQWQTIGVMGRYRSSTGFQVQPGMHLEPGYMSQVLASRTLPSHGTVAQPLLPRTRVQRVSFVRRDVEEVKGSAPRIGVASLDVICLAGP